MNDKRNETNNETILEIIADKVFLLLPFVINKETIINIIDTNIYSNNRFNLSELLWNTNIASADITIFKNKLNSVLKPFLPATNSIKSTNITISQAIYLSRLTPVIEYVSFKYRCCFSKEVKENVTRKNQSR